MTSTVPVGDLPSFHGNDDRAWKLLLKALGGKRQAVVQGAQDLGEQLVPHRVAGNLVVPVQEVAGGAEFADRFIGRQAKALIKLEHLAQAFEALALPATESQGTGGLDLAVFAFFHG